MARILLDENLPYGLLALLPSHTVTHVTELDWDGLSNGRLIAAAEAAAFNIMVTADRKLRFQQNWAGRSLALVVLSTNHWPTMRAEIVEIRAAIDRVREGEILVVRLAR